MSSIHTQDERQTYEQYRSSWQLIVLFFISYLLIGCVYAVQDKLMPWALQGIGAVIFIGFIWSNVTRDGYQFSLPVLGENEHTREQSALIRAIPWLLVMEATTIFLFDNTLTPLASYLKGGTSLLDLLLGSIGGLLIGLTVSIGIANSVKAGSKGWLYATAIGPIIIVPLGVITLASSLLYPDAPQFGWSSASTLIHIIVGLFVAYAIVHERKELFGQKGGEKLEFNNPVLGILFQPSDKKYSATSGSR